MKPLSLVLGIAANESVKKVVSTSMQLGIEIRFLARKFSAMSYQ